MVHIVGAGPGAPDLITVRGQKLLEAADVVIYAGLRENCRVYNSALMTLEEVLEVIREAEEQGLDTVRLHTGDPCLYGAIREQMDAMDRLGISYDICPGVSSFCGAAAALGMEYTLPGVSQSVVITRMAGRTPVPDRESVSCFAAHGATMVVFLSAGLLDGLQRELLDGGYKPSTPAAIVYKATWPEEKTVICRLDQLADTAGREGISKTALVIVGDSVSQAGYDRSLLYHPQFTTEFRKGEES